MKKAALIFSLAFLTSCGIAPTPSSTSISSLGSTANSLQAHSSQGAPANDLGSEGDTYLDTATGDTYVKTKLGWQKVGNGQNSANSAQNSSNSETNPVVSSSSQTTNSSPSAPTSSSVAPSSSSAVIPFSSSSNSLAPIASFEPVGGHQWNVSPTLYGEAFMVALGKELAATQTASASYSACLSIGAKAAAYPNANSSTFIPFYHEAKDSEKTTTSGCNREHTWPNSRGGGDKAGGSNIECDPLMVRPTLSEDNSDRGNDVYGTGSGAWDPASIGYEGARGESARVILYVMARYAKSNNLILNNSTAYNKGTRNMGVLKTLLEWNRKYKPTEFEKTVCDRYDKMGYARNAFVDHPEFADFIWDDNGFRTTPYAGGIVTPSSSSSSSSASSSSSSSSSSSVSTNSSTYNLAQLKTWASVDGKDVAIVSANPNGGYAAMSNEHKTKYDDPNTEYPWYLKGEAVNVNGETVSKDSAYKKFHFTLNEDGYSFTVTFGSQKLYSYIDGTHYSIQLGEPSVSAKSSDWCLEAEGNGFTMYSKPDGTNKVYLQYSEKESFCGTSTATSGNILLFA